MKPYYTNHNLKPELSLYTSSPEQTEELGRIFGRHLSPGTKVGLIGDLATGKTCFVKGVVKELCGDCWVHSPTFTLINQYGKPPRVLHIDCYRIQDEREIIDMGSEEWLSDNLICLIEWADRVIHIIPDDAIYIYFYHVQLNKRKMEIYNTSPHFLCTLKQNIPPSFYEI